MNEKMNEWMNEWMNKLICKQTSNCISSSFDLGKTFAVLWTLYSNVLLAGVKPTSVLSRRVKTY